MTMRGMDHQSQTEALDQTAAKLQAQLLSAQSEHGNLMRRLAKGDGEATDLLRLAGIKGAESETLRSNLEAVKRAKDEALEFEASASEVARRQRARDAAVGLKKALVSRLIGEAVVLDAAAIFFVRSVHAYARASMEIATQTRLFLQSAYAPGEEGSQTAAFIDHGFTNDLSVALQTILRAAFHPLPNNGGDVVELAGQILPVGYLKIVDGAAAPAAARLGMAVDQHVRDLGLDRDAPATT
jgi:hypothetical protein